MRPRRPTARAHTRTARTDQQASASKLVSILPLDAITPLSPTSTTLTQPHHPNQPLCHLCSTPLPTKTLYVVTAAHRYAHKARRVVVDSQPSDLDCPCIVRSSQVRVRARVQHCHAHTSTHTHTTQGCELVCDNACTDPACVTCLIPCTWQRRTHTDAPTQAHTTPTTHRDTRTHLRRFPRHPSATFASPRCPLSHTCHPPQHTHAHAHTRQSQLVKLVEAPLVAR